MNLIRCNQVCFAYDGALAVQDVDLNVAQEDYLCIVGENGTGKTTLMKGMLGLIKPIGGSVEYAEGIDRGSFGYIPQHTAVSRDFPATVREIVRSGTLHDCGFRPFYPSALKQRAQETMELLGIARLADQSYTALSGGQQQRVLLARALCASKKLLLLDEPANGLDPVALSEFYELLGRLHREQGIGIVMISHDEVCVNTYATKILHLDRTALFFGDAEQYRKTALCKQLLGGKR